MSIPDISKIAMYEYWCDCEKLKCGDNARLCKTDFNSFIELVKSEDVYADFVQDVEVIYDT